MVCRPAPASSSAHRRAASAARPASGRDHQAPVGVAVDQGPQRRAHAAAGRPSDDAVVVAQIQVGGDQRIGIESDCDQAGHLGGRCPARRAHQRRETRHGTRRLAGRMRRRSPADGRVGSTIATWPTCGPTRQRPGGRSGDAAASSRPSSAASSTVAQRSTSRPDTAPPMAAGTSARRRAVTTRWTPADRPSRAILASRSIASPRSIRS